MFNYKMNKNTNMITHITLIIVSLVIIDSIWIYTISNKFSTMIKSIQGTDITLNWTYIILIYLALAFGIYYFTKDCSTMNCKLINAFIFGLLSYAVYDLTNLATFNKWDIYISLADILWGGILASSSMFISIKLLDTLNF